MIKNSKVAEVLVPSATLATMAKVLVNQEPGVNIHTLVSALSVGRDENLTAIQVALALHGYSQEASKETRYKNESYPDSISRPQKVVYRLTYLRTAIFDQKVEFEQEVIYVDNSNVEECNAIHIGNKEIQTCSITAWENEFAKDLAPELIKLSGTEVPAKVLPRKKGYELQ